MRTAMIKCLSWLLLLSLCILLNSAAKATSVTPDSFVKSFYVALDDAEKVTSIGRTEKLKDFFDNKLYQLMLKDDEVRDNNQEPTVCGFLRFDAFENDRKNRGANNHYVVIKNSKPLLVSVAFLDNEGPAVYVQITPDKDTWKIVDILYPDPDPKIDGKKSLVALLQAAQAQKCVKTVKSAE